MDYDTILTSVKTNRLVVLERSLAFASVASGVLIVQERAFDFLDAPIQRTTAILQRLILSLIERMVCLMLMM
jgi:pyruvate dehydrogenase E1 component beta subunit